MNAERFANDVANGHAWVQRCKRILENHLHHTPKAQHGCVAQPRDVFALEDYFSGTWFDQVDDRSCGR